MEFAKSAAPNALLWEGAPNPNRDDRVTDYWSPKRVLWHNDGAENAQSLLRAGLGQALIRVEGCCALRKGGAVLLDYGAELQGGVRIVAYHPEGQAGSLRLRVRFGESAAEAISDLGGDTNATNDHAVRDSVVAVSAMGATLVGGTGFRFVRIDALDDCGILLQEVQAAFTHRDIRPSGSFACSDPELGRVWRTGAYTVFLNMQGMVWDGIKRDRLVWIGDMHPEVSTIQAVFGYDPVVPRSLDFARDTTPSHGWMNTIPSYSMWWVLLQDGWYLQNGDLDYLTQQKDYLRALLARLADCVVDGCSRIDGFAFLDWPSSPNQLAVAAGVGALHGWSLQRGAALLRILGEPALAERCEAAAAALAKAPLSPNGGKQAAALQALAGHVDAQAVNRDVLSQNGTAGLSTFLGYHVLQARAMAGDIQGCLETIRGYWGGMLKLGATTFWEHFDTAWLRDAAPIDKLPKAGQIDVHAAYGDYCFKGYRHSLCHGWAGGPTAWLSEHVLGVRPLKPGCAQVRVAPRLGDLTWAEGAYPTPHGVIRVRHECRADGTLKTEVEAPQGVEICQ